MNLNDSPDKNRAVAFSILLRLIVNNKGELRLDCRRNPWNLTNIIDWNGAGKPEK